MRDFPLLRMIIRCGHVDFSCRMHNDAIDNEKKDKKKGSNYKEIGQKREAKSKRSVGVRARTVDYRFGWLDKTRA